MVAAPEETEMKKMFGAPFPIMATSYRIGGIRSALRFAAIVGLPVEGLTVVTLARLVATITLSGFIAVSASAQPAARTLTNRSRRVPQAQKPPGSLRLSQSVRTSHFRRSSSCHGAGWGASWPFWCSACPSPRRGETRRQPLPRACSLSPSLPPEAPSLRRHYPASSVVRASPPPCPARPRPHGSSVGVCHATGRASPRCAHSPLPCMPPPIPRRRGSMLPSLASRPVTAFPVLPAGRLPHYPFRGLHSVQDLAVAGGNRVTPVPPRRSVRAR